MLPCLFEISKLSLKELHTIMIFWELGILTRLVWIKFVKRYLSLLSRVKKFSSKLNNKKKTLYSYSYFKKNKKLIFNPKKKKNTIFFLSDLFLLIYQCCCKTIYHHFFLSSGMLGSHYYHQHHRSTITITTCFNFYPCIKLYFISFTSLDWYKNCLLMKQF